MNEPTEVAHLTISPHQWEKPHEPPVAVRANWLHFVSTVDEVRIREAERSLRELLQVPDLAGNTFLDIGCGSGLFSLAARRLGARVQSFDYDAQSVACAESLRSRYYPNDAKWVVQEGSVLDPTFMAPLRDFDVVYSWGVLHHTGKMWDALANAALAVKPGGRLAVAIYNDEGPASTLWTTIKRTYCASTIGRWAVIGACVPLFAAQAVVAGLVRYGRPLARFTDYKRKRGMSIVHDWIDWLGGYPFEVAKPEQIFHFYRQRGFRLINMTTTNRLGCNELVFVRES